MSRFGNGTLFVATCLTGLMKTSTSGWCEDERNISRRYRIIWVPAVSATTTLRAYWANPLKVHYSDLACWRAGWTSIEQCTRCCSFKSRQTPTRNVVTQLGAYPCLFREQGFEGWSLGQGLFLLSPSSAVCSTMLSDESLYRK